MFKAAASSEPVGVFSPHQKKVWVILKEENLKNIHHNHLIRTLLQSCKSGVTMIFDVTQITQTPLGNNKQQQVCTCRHVKAARHLTQKRLICSYTSLTGRDFVNSVYSYTDESESRLQHAAPSFLLRTFRRCSTTHIWHFVKIWLSMCRALQLHHVSLSCKS